MSIDWSFAIGLAGTVAFSVTAVLAVVPKGIDIFGALVMGVITAIGGGTIRDVILNVPVFWSTEIVYIWVAIAASLAAFVANSLFARTDIYKVMLYIDGVGVALFAVQATSKVWDLNFGLPIAPIILGVVTAIGGGLIRDVLAGRQTLLMSRDIYAIPVLIGCTAYVLLLEYFPESHALSGLVCSSFIFAMRAAAIHWNLSVPDWLATRPQNG